MQESEVIEDDSGIDIHLGAGVNDRRGKVHKIFPKLVLYHF